mgnify:FL=1
MAKDKMYGKTLRKNFARHEEIMEMPNLLELQKKSYRWFLDEGLQEVFTDVASITNYAGNLELSFIGYKMDEAPKYDVEECKARDATYAAPLKVNVRLYNNQTQEIKEQEKDFLKNALDGLITARQTESYPICGMDEVTLEYLIAVLAMEFEKYDISSRLIYNILNTPTVNNRIKDKAREVKDELLQQMGKK